MLFRSGARVSPGFSIGHTHVGKGKEAFMSLFSLHRNPEYFSDPDTFLPERWLDPNSRDEIEAFQPFSTGSRSCIGKHLALQVLRLTLVRLALEFEPMCEKPLNDIASSKCYAVWELPSLLIRLRSRLVDDDVSSSSSCR